MAILSAFERTQIYRRPIVSWYSGRGQNRHAVDFGVQAYYLRCPVLATSVLTLPRLAESVMFRSGVRLSVRTCVCLSRLSNVRRTAYFLTLIRHAAYTQPDSPAYIFVPVLRGRTYLLPTRKYQHAMIDNVPTISVCRCCMTSCEG